MDQDVGYSNLRGSGELKIKKFNNEDDKDVEDGVTGDDPCGDGATYGEEVKKLGASESEEMVEKLASSDGEEEVDKLVYTKHPTCSRRMSGRRWVQYLASVAADLGQSAAGCAISTSSFLLPQLQSGQDDLVLSEEGGSWFASVLMIGAITGGLVGGWQCEVIGRRLSMMIDCVLMTCGILLISMASSIPMLLVGRFLTGHATGSNLVTVPIFVSEISHPDIRGVTGSFLMLLYTSGFTLQLLLGAALPWRWALRVTMGIPITSILLLYFMHDSPKWLHRKKETDKSFIALMFYRGDSEVVKKELKRCSENLEKEEILSQEMGYTYLGRLKFHLKCITRPGFLKPFLFLTWMICFGLDCSGFPALAFYMHTLLDKMNIPLDTYWVAVGLAAYRAVVTISCSFILGKVKKRPVYMTAGFTVASATAIIATHSWIGPRLDPQTEQMINWVPLAGVVLMYTGFGIGYGPIVFILQGELLPANLRGFGSALIGIIDNIIVFVVVKNIPNMMQVFGVSGSFYIFSVTVLFNLVVIFFTMPETKGLSLEDIEDYYSKDTKLTKKKANDAINL